MVHIFATWLYQFTLPTAVCLSTGCSTSWSTLGPRAVLICFSVIRSETEHLSLCLWGISRFFFCLHHLPIFNCLTFCFWIFNSSSHIRDTSLCWLLSVCHLPTVWMYAWEADPDIFHHPDSPDSWLLVGCRQWGTLAEEGRVGWERGWVIFPFVFLVQQWLHAPW